MVELELVDKLTVPEHDERTEMARLRKEIAQSRRRLDSSWHEIEHRVAEGVDLRRQLAAHPWLSLAAAVMVGYLFGSLTSTGAKALPPAR